MISFLGPQPIRGFISELIRLFISDTYSTTLTDSNGKEVVPSSSSSSSSDFTRRRFFKLIFSFFGLQISYLLWGLLQERIMTRTYADEKFSNSQFLVFVNRFLAAIIAYASLRMFFPMKKLTPTGPPLFQYGIISYANCMSTWFQYESLLYISFPVQVIAKSVKTIPVMIVGKFVSGKTYPFRQYILMFIMAMGIALFLFGYQESGTLKLTSKRAKQNITTLNGVILLICYLVSTKFIRKNIFNILFFCQVFDAFTSNYQKHVFDHYSISFLNMMFFVNLISTILTLTSLIFNGTLFECLLFMKRHRTFAMHVFATSICSSIGQLFIFSTIEEFGPVIFTIIMTMRQAFSILLSCIFYGHQLSWFSIVGIHIAFLAIFIHAFIQFKRSKQSNTNVV
jgi:adenosine 3'-phospho 5'-phosphosulfate transporter B2